MYCDFLYFIIKVNFNLILFVDDLYNYLKYC